MTTATKPLPEHGTYARANGSPGYRKPCNCEPCTLEKRRANKRWKLRKARGLSASIDATPAREHLAMLRETRTWESIAQASDVTYSSLMYVASGTRETIHVNTHNAILAVKPLDKPLPSLQVDSLISRRRLRALMVIGYSTRVLARECRVAKDRVHEIAMDLQPTVRYDIAERIEAAYERLAFRPPALDKYTARTRNLAASRGWHGPLAWDGNIDDPAAEPEALGSYKPVAKNGRDSMRKAEIEHLYLLGESIPSIARQLGGNEKYVSDQLAAALRERSQRIARQQDQAVAA